MHQISRRLFMGSVAGAGAGLALPFVTIAEPRQEADPVLMHVGREMARLYKQQRSGLLAMNAEVLRIVSSS